MKKSAQWMVSVFALLFVVLNVSYAEQAKDLTAMAHITMSGKQGYFDSAMTDNRYRTAWFTKSGYVQFDLPDGEMCYGIYICLSEQTVTFSVQKNTDGQWEDVQFVHPEFLHVYVPFKEGMTSFRICCRDERDDIYLRVAEIRLLGEGELPEWVQNWYRLDEKADLLIFTAHPDDELLWFGGTIPTYAAELGKNVQLVCMTAGERQRMNEALQKHRSQFPLSQDMKQGGVYDCRKFGLYFSIVGADEAGNDFFEHIQPSAALIENK